MEVTSSTRRERLLAQLPDDETPLSRSAHYGLAAIGLMRTPLAQVNELRKQLGPPGGPPFPINVLRSSDEQTVVGVAAVLQAIEQGGLGGQSLATWGIIAAPRYLGKLSAGAALHKYAAGGAWKVSPMVVPHHCLHAMSGTISQALDIKGPNFGAGGGASALVDGLITACTLLDENTLPGLWLVMTQCYPEPVFDPDNDQPVTDCCAMALGFAPAAEDWRGLRLRIVRTNVGGAAAHHPTNDVHQYFELFQFLQQGQEKGQFGAWSCLLDWRARFVLSDEG